MATHDEGFLQRWSRRKAEVRQTVTEESAPDTAVPATDESASPDPPDAAPVAPPGGTDDGPPLDLPDIETLDKDSDFTPFMQAGVPEELKIRALRKLWLSDPALAGLDGLNDYDDDFAAMARSGEAFMRDVYKRVTANEPELEAPEEPAPHTDTDAADLPDDDGDTATPIALGDSEADATAPVDDRQTDTDGTATQS